MERVTQAGKQVANRRVAAAASARIAWIAAHRLAAFHPAGLAARGRLAARSRFAAGRLAALWLAAAIEQIAKLVPTLGSTTGIAAITARSAAATTICRPGIAASVRFASVAMGAGILEHLGLCRGCRQHQHRGHRKGG